MKCMVAGCGKVIVARKASPFVLLQHHIERAHPDAVTDGAEIEEQMIKLDAQARDRKRAELDGPLGPDEPEWMRDPPEPEPPKDEVVPLFETRVDPQSGRVSMGDGA